MPKSKCNRIKQSKHRLQPPKTLDSLQFLSHYSRAHLVSPPEMFSVSRDNARWPVDRSLGGRQELLAILLHTSGSVPWAAAVFPAPLVPALAAYRARDAGLCTLDERIVGVFCSRYLSRFFAFHRSTAALRLTMWMGGGGLAVQCELRHSLFVLQRKSFLTPGISPLAL